MLDLDSYLCYISFNFFYASHQQLLDLWHPRSNRKHIVHRPWRYNGSDGLWTMRNQIWTNRGKLSFSQPHPRLPPFLILSPNSKRISGEEVHTCGLWLLMPWSWTRNVGPKGERKQMFNNYITFWTLQSAQKHKHCSWHTFLFVSKQSRHSTRSMSKPYVPNVLREPSRSKTRTASVENKVQEIGSHGDTYEPSMVSLCVHVDESCSLWYIWMLRNRSEACQDPQ